MHFFILLADNLASVFKKENAYKEQHYLAEIYPVCRPVFIYSNQSRIEFTVHYFIG